MNLIWVLLVVLIVLALAGGWGYRAGYSGPYYYGGGGILGVVLLVLLILLLVGRL